MARSFGGTVKLTGESEYTKALKTITSNLTVMVSEMKVVSSQFDKNDKSVQAITSRNSVLNKEIDEGNKKISIYKTALEDFNKQQDKNAEAMMDMMLNLEKENKKLEDLKNNTSSTSEEIKKQERVVSELTIELSKAESQYEKNKSTINKYQKELNLSQAEVNNLTTQLNNNQKELEDNRSTYQKLNDTIEEQKNKLITLKEKYASIVLEQGKNSSEAKMLKTEIKGLNENIKENETRISSAKNEIEDFTHSEKEASTQTISFGDIIKANLISETIIAGVKSLASAMNSVVKGIVDIGKKSLQSYADYEQLVGGVETLFALSEKEIQEYADVYGISVEEVKANNELMSNSIETVIGNANRAYKTAGLSANEYMETITSFSASLLQSLGGNTFDTLEYADRAIRDMSDNANKMGSDISQLQATYNSFSKANYTLLDNLKLGYGGTKSEMERLIQDASKMKDVQEELGITVDASSISFGNIVNAISVVQKSMGITGTTAKEASTTISGSLASMKSSWENLLTGIANDQVDLEKLIFNFVESVITVGNNILPRVSVIIEGIVELIMKLPAMIMSHMPTIIETGKNILQSLLNGIVTLIPELIPVVFEIVNTFINFLIENLPVIINTGIEVLLSLINGITESLPELIPVIVDAVLLIVYTLIDNIDLIIDAGISLILALTDGLIEAMPILIEKAPVIIEKLVNALIRNFPKIITAGGELIGNLISGLVGSFWKLLEVAPQIISTMVKGIKTGYEEIKKTGIYIVEGIWNGVSGKAEWIYDKMKSFANNIVGNVKKALRINSPSKTFEEEIGYNLAWGVGKGFVDKMDNVTTDIENAIPTEFDLGLNTNLNTFNGESSNLSKDILIDSFKEALSGMTFKAFDETFGELVVDNVEKVVYS